ncbi:MAG: hypothetical protein M1818_005711 [Claussenomyces sp. TS43310]|nr:MAG: hypothetical protein M1818_005711 [Claussenomyces sp. TS43310]
MDTTTSKWGSMEWRRRLETFGVDDGPVIASGPKGETDSICNLGELTDQGRRSTHALGERLRHLYVDQLKFMPSMIDSADMIYLRATPIPRALESLQETFWGMYPSKTRAASFPPPTIITRAPADETLFPNDGNCRRFAQLSRAFAQRTADRWNQTEQMDYLNHLISKWMPESSKRVAVDSRPRLSGIMDTINSTLAHPAETRLPDEFYDKKGREIIDKIGVEEWFSGYKESREYRALGIGGLMGDVVSRMVGSVEMNARDGLDEVGGESGETGPPGRGGEIAIKLGLSGCHDTTLASALASLGAFENENWPPYTSHIALELFKKKGGLKEQATAKLELEEVPAVAAEQPQKTTRGFFGRTWRLLVGAGGDSNGVLPSPSGISRKKVDELSDTEKSKLDGYFVRIRYNDKVMNVPGCKLAGKHLDGDESFCTLEAFKAIVDKFTPLNWKQDCRSKIDTPAFPPSPEPAGF